MTTIRFTKRCASYRENQVISVKPAEANVFVAIGVAEIMNDSDSFDKEIKSDSTVKKKKRSPKTKNTGE
ncbi:hypothetical protein [Salinicola sp. CPA57]|uniref:hypothetical protein n=1 Tax=Salinicola sp. CPA57 TaxID=1949080 RepID=UPI0013005F97|nr:hypothetical protein [Salinicola sp. CPA57]